MNLPFIKLFADSSETIEMLSDAEAGRLLKSLLRYVNDKELNLSGNEKFVFGMLKAQMDRDAAGYQAYLDKQRANGMRGGRPRKNPENPPVSDENPKNPLVFEETQESLNKEMCVDIDGTTDTDENDIETHTLIQHQGDNAGARARKGWFDPANPEAGDDEAWRQSEKARKATVQRLIAYVVNNGFVKNGVTYTEAGNIGQSLFDVLYISMCHGVTPLECLRMADGAEETWEWEFRLKAYFTDKFGRTEGTEDWKDQVDELREDVVLNMLAIHPKKRCVLKKLEEQYERRIHHAKQSV